MNDENPFKTLGFNPRAFDDLRDEEIFSLAKAQYRALMQLHHPDVSKRRNAEKRSTEISLAFAQINLESDSASFTYWKEAFTKPARRNAELASSRVSALQISAKREETLQENLIGCLKHVYAAKPVRPIEIPAPIATVNDGCAMVLEDTIKSSWLFGTEGPWSRKQTRQAQWQVMQQRASAVDPILFELETTREGAIVYRKLMLHSLKSKDPDPPKGTWVRRDANGSGYYWVTLPDIVRTVRARIVGSISSDRLRQFWNEIGPATNRRIHSGLSAEETTVVESAGYTTDQVKPFLWLLTPELHRGSIVVSMSPAGDKFLFLGKLSLIADKSKAPRV